ncbi:hypothetical protein [Paenibacillus sp. YYML68]|uniref:Ger(x)C family spore germination protein n=1 Tax=Paenibacillus sp. YYML68 TaxID=2909250 RepID=UPI0024930894|nr:hypothetical protein [Paenibacillus sp. YYML68]
MLKPVITCVLCLLLAIPLTGCWNRKELNDLAIAGGLAIDQADASQYKVTVQVVDPSEVASRKGGGGRSPVLTFEATAPSVFEAIRKLTTSSPRKIYLSHLRIVVLGQQLAERGIAKPLEFLSRDHEVRSDFFVILAKDAKASDILK